MLPGNYGSHANNLQIVSKIGAILPTVIDTASFVLDQTFHVGFGYIANLGQHIPPFSVFMGYHVPWNSPANSGNVESSMGSPNGSNPQGPVGHVSYERINQCYLRSGKKSFDLKKRYKRKVRKNKFNKKQKRNRFTI